MPRSSRRRRRPPPDAAVEAPRGKPLTMTVDGTETAVEAGQTYSGAIVPTVQ
ncbi:hypothetical protein [Streptomyces ipomoeae]|uniref:hypothetical protein n=1 Tax=Streptomyces ipomoeae TaxID=103232 RepID=UPI0015F10EDF|nr:hypothetical protein [Streptomyces ipomoeae]MDX2938226.1 hypothetical protein [Streptomyces ipomoeae]